MKNASDIYSKCFGPNLGFVPVFERMTFVEVNARVAHQKIKRWFITCSKAFNLLGVGHVKDGLRSWIRILKSAYVNLSLDNSLTTCGSISCGLNDIASFGIKRPIKNWLSIVGGLALYLDFTGFCIEVNGDLFHVLSLCEVFPELV